MNASMNLHNVVFVTAEVRKLSDPDNALEWVRFEFVTEDRSRFSLSAITADAVALLRQITQPHAEVEQQS